MSKFNMKVTPEIEKLTQICRENDKLDLSLYGKYDVKRGLRDLNGKGVLAGLTQISNVQATKIVDGKEVPCAGKLSYRGYDIKDLTNGFINDRRFGFEEVTYLLLFGKLPNQEELNEFSGILANQRQLPRNFVRDVIMKAPSRDIMNALSRSVLTLYSYDKDPDNIELENVLRQCINLISVFPLLSVYAYQAYNHYEKGKSLYIHQPKKELSTAENILRLLRPDKKYTALEAEILDIALILHMEHGGGNNSTFSTRVLTSSGTDTYSAITAGFGSLKGPRHGGANIRVTHMMEDIIAHVADPTKPEQVKDYLVKILNKEAGDGSGLIYGMGHAVYTKSDPRAVILKSNARKLAYEAGFEKEFKTLENVEKLTPEVFAEVKGDNKVMCANVDLYSGLVYKVLKIPEDLFTPLFATARIAGWCAHRLEELISGGRIMRPAYKSVSHARTYIAPADREVQG